jgi:hypothetical protein
MERNMRGSCPSHPSTRVNPAGVKCSSRILPTNVTLTSAAAQRKLASVLGTVLGFYPVRFDIMLCLSRGLQLRHNAAHICWETTGERLYAG